MIHVPIGESGIGTGSRLTQERLDAFSAWFALPTALKIGDIPKDTLALAKHFGVSTKFIEEAKRDPRMVKATADRLHAVAVYAMPDVLWAQVGLATEKKDTKAARFVGEIAGALKQGAGVNIQNTMVQPIVEEVIDDEALYSIVEEVAKRERGRKWKEGADGG